MTKKKTTKNSSPPTGNSGGFKKFLKSLLPTKRSKSEVSGPLNPTNPSSNSGPSYADLARGFSFDSAPANTSRPAARVGPQEPRREGRQFTDTELANLERKRRRMSAQGQIEGLSSNTASSSHFPTNQEKAQAKKVEERDETESIQTTSKGYRAPSAIGCVP